MSCRHGRGRGAPARPDPWLPYRCSWCIWARHGTVSRSPPLAWPLGQPVVGVVGLPRSSPWSCGQGLGGTLPRPLPLWCPPPCARIPGSLAPPPTAACRRCSIPADGGQLRSPAEPRRARVGPVPRVVDAGCGRRQPRGQRGIPSHRQAGPFMARPHLSGLVEAYPACYAFTAPKTHFRRTAQPARPDSEISQFCFFSREGGR